jgi:threonine dehydrogenase-like Zn-dependent dehydrogenase
MFAPRLWPIDRDRRGTGGRGDFDAAVPTGDRPDLERHRLRRRARPHDVPKIFDWYMQGKLPVDPMITHVMPLAEINNAFELMKRGG